VYRYNANRMPITPEDPNEQLIGLLSQLSREEIIERIAGTTATMSPKRAKPSKRETTKRSYGTGEIRETPTGFMVVVDVSEANGPRRRRSATFTTRDEATKWRDSVKGDRARSVRQPEKRPISTGAFLEAWLAGPDVTTNRLTESTQRQYNQVARSYLIPILGTTQLVGLTPTKVSAAWAKLAKPGAVESLKKGRARNNDTLSPNTVALARRTFRAAMTCAVRDGLLPSNPATLSQLPYPKGTIKPKPDPMSTTELALLEKKWTEHRVGPLVQFALATGLREGEVLALRTVDIDHANRTLHVHRNLSRKLDGSYIPTDTAKTKSSIRIVPLGELAEEALKAERARQAAERLLAGTAWHNNDLVFATPIGTPRNPRNTQRDWHALLNAAGIAPRRFHTIRHSCATYLLNGGLPMEAVSKILGHSTTAVTNTAYAEVTQRLTAPAAAIIDAALRNAR
jgi:integrase